MALRFEDERYVRIFTRQTLTSKRLGWEGRTVLHELFLHLDRCGLFSLSGEDPYEAVAAITEIPIEHVRVGLKRALDKGCLIHIDIDQEGYLLSPRFLEAQEARSSNSLRQRAKRDRARARSKLIGIASETGHPELQRIAERLQSTEREYSKLLDDEKNGDFISIGDDNQVAATHDVSQTTFDGSGRTHRVSLATPVEPDPTHDVSQATQSDTQYRTVPSRTVPSRTDQVGGGRARAREARTDHPDGLFLDDGQVGREDFVPPAWLLEEWHLAGAGDEVISEALRDYRAEGRMEMATTAQHAKAVAKWMKHRLAQQRPNGGHREASGKRIARGAAPDESTSPRGANEAPAGRARGPRGAGRLDEIAKRRAAQELARLDALYPDDEDIL